MSKKRIILRWSRVACLSIVLILFLTACLNNSEISSPTNIVVDQILPTVNATKTLSIPMTPALTKPVGQTATPVFLSNAPETLGIIQYLQYSYSIFHSRDFDACTSNPIVCPDIYHALLSDVHTWMYIQAGQTAWLDFKLEGKYQIKPSVGNNTACDFVQDTENIYLIGVTCREVGEYTLQFDLVNEEQQRTYPLILQFVNIPELLSPSPTIPSELSVEEYELVQRPNIDPLFFKPVIGNSNTILAVHETERGQPVEGAYATYLDDGQFTQAVETTQATGLSDPSHVVNITITQNGSEIFAKQSLISPIRAFHGLWSIGNSWFAEIIAAWDYNSFRSVSKGDIFKDGISLNETFGYTESFGFQLLHGKPFYFFEKFGRIGVSYNGQDIALGYDYVPHHGCCSVGELNPKMYENMVGFFAVRGDKWYYVEIGVYE